ncbi:MULTISPECIES: hypothetical protein [unclassified Cellulophaga]|uniref:hypothetical protein n=1 Tax=unclassified Cellulophaga TaxID=2634405 RepID=UPI000CC8A17D|nr:MULTISPECIES: hypothetical protein [unclassified Cellulophaga]MDO6490983.1 hypothetical protein [Cellulophaga sp. 2_MG-2023]MDO6493823.1 hypothetical protein [Cellulophaga sp. 3_MG-2023]PKB44163.1 hypothetical protein AX016_2377 [Cellulophaga sp. RHA19]
MPRAIILIIVVFAAIIIFSVFIMPKKKKNNIAVVNDTKSLKSSKVPVVVANQSLSYADRLLETKKYYPFAMWQTNFTEFNMEQYTEENCSAARHIFNTLIANLITLGENGKEIEKVSFFETAVTELNNLNSNADGLIETGEREDLCELIDHITIAADLKPDDYADGEGLADLWREW